MNVKRALIFIFFAISLSSMIQIFPNITWLLIILDSDASNWLELVLYYASGIIQNACFIVLAILALVHIFKKPNITNAARFTYEEYKEKRLEKKKQKMQAKKEKLQQKLNEMEKD